ncbi:hypothetical protein K432DRAFT_377852 [Lepidopterella palustris CBS 459.81]|uniref:Uncharacterized protein n=1 Tax=Lepidopterella palustris CBS 459.81 TaxID=1314670 RepID=A0A8E2EJQ0_9PEZI|nr:hypothetical protein K432DRAFT_377852 [Lepidopterella palustris CBS 459.81]
MFSTINSISGGGQELGWPETKGPSLIVFAAEVAHRDLAHTTTAAQKRVDARRDA